MTTISKTEITFTVLHRSDSPPQDIHDAVGQAMDGHMIGLETSVETVHVPDDMVPAELVGLGAVPDFFQEDLHGG